MTTKRFNEDDDKSIVEYGKMKQKELLNEIVKVERKYDLTFAEYIVCEKCGTIAYGDGNCHCGKNDWKVWGFDLREKIKEIKNENN